MTFSLIAVCFEWFEDLGELEVLAFGLRGPLGHGLAMRNVDGRIACSGGGCRLRPCSGRGEHGIEQWQRDGDSAGAAQDVATGNMLLRDVVHGGLEEIGFAVLRDAYGLRATRFVPVAARCWKGTLSMMFMIRVVSLY